MKQFILTILLIAGTVVAAMHLLQTKPEPKKKERKITLPVVEVLQPKPQEYNITIRTAGTVESHNKTSIVSEIAGKITYISPNFEEGQYFNKKEKLFKINDSNYRNAIAIAQADIKQKQLALQDTKNQTSLSSNQWKLYSKSRQDSELATLKIKTASSYSAVHAANLRLKQTQMDLANTIITAPYAGRVLSRDVGIGQYVGPGTKLGAVYSTDFVEVRLPLTLDQYDLLDLPENYRNSKKSVRKKSPLVTFYSKSKSKNKQKQWKGRIIRSSPIMDERTRQISVIARIDDPFKKPKDNHSIVKIGQFLQAEIKTKTLQNIFILPNRAVRQHKEVLLLSNGIIQVRAITPLYSEGDKVIIAASSLPSNPTVITTPMAKAKTGTKVKLYKPKNTNNHKREE